MSSEQVANPVGGESDPTLSEEEACALLDVPPFLLRDFISYEFNGLKLEPLDPKVKQRKFKQSVVEGFKAHLESPWPGDERPAIPAWIEHYLVLEAAGRCGLCREEKADYDLAHIQDWAKSRCHSPHNIIRLCVACHRSYGKAAKKLSHAKELIRRRLVVDRIYVGEARVDELEMRLWLQNLVLLTLGVGVISLLLVLLKATPLPRHVDAASLSARLAGAASVTSQLRIETAQDQEAHALGHEISEAFKRAGWSVELTTPQPYLAGRGVHLLIPMTGSHQNHWPDPSLRPVFDAIAAEAGEDFRVYTTPSSDYRRDVVIIRVLMNE